MAQYTANLFSKSTNLNTQVTIVVPDYPYDVGPEREDCKPKLLYLLHGWSDNASNWTRMTRAEYYAKKYNFILVMPEVEHSFYSNMRFGLDYNDYIAKELPGMLHNTFKLPADRAHTFMAGLSMGGYGTLKIGLANYKNYAGLASFSALTDMAAQMERAKKDPQNTHASHRDLYSVFGPDLKLTPESDLYHLMAEVAPKKDRPRYLQTIGTEDSLYEDNQKWRAYLEKLGYGHTYLEWKDGHMWTFWDRSLELAMRFFNGEEVAATDAGSFHY